MTDWKRHSGASQLSERVMHYRLANLKVMHYKLFNQFVNLLLPIWTTSSIVMHHQLRRCSGASRLSESDASQVLRLVKRVMHYRVLAKGGTVEKTAGRY